MHGAPGGPTSSGLYDAATEAFRRWRDEDEAARDDLVRVMSPVLWHVVRATGLDKEAAEDVVQNTWLTLVRSADSVRDPQAITRWLCTAARREAWRVSKASTRIRRWPARIWLMASGSLCVPPGFRQTSLPPAERQRSSSLSRRRPPPSGWSFSAALSA